MTARQSVATRFWSKVDTSGGCWIWQAHTDKKGYGTFSVDGRMKKAHRVAFELARGQIAEGLTLDHLCRNTSCVNPGHLDPVPIAENIRRSPRITREACPMGHPYPQRYASGRRVCRSCYRDYKRDWYQRRKAIGARARY